MLSLKKDGLSCTDAQDCSSKRCKNGDKTLTATAHALLQRRCHLRKGRVLCYLVRHVLDAGILLTHHPY